MKREQFILELRRKLKRLPKDEIDKATSYYNEYFEECNKTDEEAIKELGSPSLVASQILADYAFDDKKQSNGWGYKILLIILAIFAAPIGLPLGIAAIAVLFALLVALGIIVFVFGIVVFAFFASGIFSFIGGACVIFTSPATSMFYIGAGMATIGLGIFIAYAIKNLVPKAYLYLKKITASLLSKFNRSKKGGK